MANAVQNRIIRTYFGVHKFAPTQAVTADMGFSPAQVRRKVEMVRLWCRLVRLDISKITKKIFLHDLELCHQGVRNWCYELKGIFHETDQLYLFNSTTTPEFSLPRLLDTTTKRLGDPSSVGNGNMKL